MNQNNSELIEYLDQKFASIEQILESKADKEDVNNLTSSIDHVLKRLDTLNTEFLSLTNKVNRLEGWIRTVADKSGVELPK